MPERTTELLLGMTPDERIVCIGMSLGQINDKLDKIAPVVAQMGRMEEKISFHEKLIYAVWITCGAIGGALATMFINHAGAGQATVGAFIAWLQSRIG